MSIIPPKLLYGAIYTLLPILFNCFKNLNREAKATPVSSLYIAFLICLGRLISFNGDILLKKSKNSYASHIQQMQNQFFCYLLIFLYIDLKYFLVLKVQ